MFTVPAWEWCRIPATEVQTAHVAGVNTLLPKDQCVPVMHGKASHVFNYEVAQNSTKMQLVMKSPYKVNCLSSSSSPLFHPLSFLQHPSFLLGICKLLCSVDFSFSFTHWYRGQWSFRCFKLKASFVRTFLPFELHSVHKADPSFGGHVGIK